MTIVGWLQTSLLFLAVLVAIKPLGLYMARVFAGERTFLSPVPCPSGGRPLSSSRHPAGQGAGLACLHTLHAGLFAGGFRGALCDP